MSYNGYKNYETWNAWLWITNDEGLYYSMMEYVRNCKKNRTEPTYRDLIIDWYDGACGDTTGDNVGWLDPAIEQSELDENLREIADGM